MSDAPGPSSPPTISEAVAKAGGQSSELSYVVISGGTGANSIATAFRSSPAFVLPVSDDGGSSAEILRCFGGPSIGDIRESTSLVELDLMYRISSDQVDTSTRECAYQGRARTGGDL